MTELEFTALPGKPPSLTLTNEEGTRTIRFAREPGKWIGERISWRALLKLTPGSLAPSVSESPNTLRDFALLALIALASKVASRRLEDRYVTIDDIHGLDIWRNRGDSLGSLRAELAELLPPTDPNNAILVTIPGTRSRDRTHYFHTQPERLVIRFNPPITTIGEDVFSWLQCANVRYTPPEARRRGRTSSALLPSSANGDASDYDFSLVERVLQDLDTPLFMTQFGRVIWERYSTAASSDYISDVHGFLMAGPTDSVREHLEKLRVLAFYFSRFGDWERSALRAVPRFHSHPESQAVLLGIAASSRFHRGDLHGCLALIRQKAPIDAARGDLPEWIFSRIIEADCLQGLKHVPEAISTRTEIMSIYSGKTQSDPRLSVSDTYNRRSLAILHALAGNASGARQFLGEAGDRESNSTDRWKASCDTTIAKAHIALGDIDRARKILERAIPTIGSWKDERLVVDGEGLLATICEGQGERDAAYELWKSVDSGSRKLMLRIYQTVAQERMAALEGRGRKMPTAESQIDIARVFNAL